MKKEKPLLCIAAIMVKPVQSNTTAGNIRFQKLFVRITAFGIGGPILKEYTTVIIIGGEIEEHLQSLKEVEAVGFHKTKNAMPYENNLTIFIGRGLKRPIRGNKTSNKLFI